MPTYSKAPQNVVDLANAILCEFATHKPLLDAKVKVDLVFAHADLDKNGEARNYAISVRGVRALGQARKLKLKDRVMGRGDGEVLLDADWWAQADLDQQRAVIDHELHHLEVQIDERGVIRDDIGRPLLALRRHDFQFGWFSVVAARHGKASMEQIQARQIFEEAGQLYFPWLPKL